MISWACPNCQAKLRAPETAVGRKLPCPKCQSLNEVPRAASEQPASSASPPTEVAQKQPAKPSPASPAAETMIEPAARSAALGTRVIFAAVFALIGIGVVFAGGYVWFGRPTPQPVIDNGDGVERVVSETPESVPPANVGKNPGPVEQPVESTPPSGVAAKATESPEMAQSFSLVEAYGNKAIEARMTFEDSYERPFKGTLELKPGPKSPDGTVKVICNIGDCIDGYMLTEPVEVQWTPKDRAPKSLTVKVLGCRWNQISMARAGRTQRGGVWKADALPQMILRNEELRSAGDAVWQVAIMLIEPESGFRGHRDQFANTPYEVTDSQWKFASAVLQKLRPLAEQVEREEKAHVQAATAAMAVRLPLLSAIREQRIKPRFAFSTLLDPKFTLEFKVAPGAENRRLEMWAPEALRVVVETKPGVFQTFFLCDLELSTAKAVKHFQTGDFSWSGIAYSAAPLEPEPVNENALYEYRTGAKQPQFGEVDPVVAHLAANSLLDPVKKQLAIWLHHNPALSADGIKALGQKYDNPILSTLPESIMEDARIALRSSQWQVEQFPDELRKGRLNDYFVGVWKPTEFIHARAAAVNFQIPDTLQNPHLPAGELERYRQQLTSGFTSGIEIEQLTLTLFPDLRFEAKGSYHDHPVAASGNWRWNGAKLEFPLWKDGKGNDPFLESGARANLPMALLIDRGFLGEAIRPDNKPKPRGAFLQKLSSDPGTAVDEVASAAKPGISSPPSAKSNGDPLAKALGELEIQNQAAKADAKNLRIRTLYDAVREGLVNLSIKVVEPKPKSSHFMHKEAEVTIRRSAAANRLNLQLLCAAPMQFEMESSSRSKIPVIVSTGRPEPVELPAIQEQVTVMARCFPLKWEQLPQLQSLAEGIPGEIDPRASFLAAIYGGVYMDGSLEEVAEFYAEHWKRILSLREKEEKQMKAQGVELAYIAEDHQRWLENNYTFEHIDILGHMPGFEVDEHAKEMCVALMFLQNPAWKAEQLLRYAHSPAVVSSQATGGDPNYLGNEFAPVPSGSAMFGHHTNFQGYLLAKYCREQVDRFPELLRSTKTPNECGTQFLGRWKSIDAHKAAEIAAQITPRTTSAHEATKEMAVRRSKGEPMKVGVSPVSVSILEDHSFIYTAEREGAPEEKHGFWQWDGCHFWIGKAAYHVHSDYLVSLRYDRGFFFATIFERENSSAPAVGAPVAQERLPSKPETQTGDVAKPSEPAKPASTKALTSENVVGQWKPADRDRAVAIRLTVMRRKVDAMFGGGQIELNEDLKTTKAQMLARALEEAAKDLKIPEIEFRLDANKTFTFKSRIKGAESEASGKWSVKSGKLILEKDKFTRLEFEAIEGGLYGESIPFGEVFLTRPEK